MKENLKIKNLLNKVLENKEFEYSFKDELSLGVPVYHKWTLIYTMEVGKVLGEGSGSVADVRVIISDIKRNGKSVYNEWVEENYTENAWYIDMLNDHLIDEVFSLFPFSIYPTFYGYDEERN